MDLTVADSWKVGTHNLTAKDSGGFSTQNGVILAFVPQGEAHTPGPYGAPPDDTSFVLDANVRYQSTGTTRQSGSYKDLLIVTGHADPAGGTVCQAIDNGQPQIQDGDAGNGYTFHRTFVWSCKGSYKGGKLTYIETTVGDKNVFSNGVTCKDKTPFVTQELDGTFTSSNTIRGIMKGDRTNFTCDQGVGNGNDGPYKGTWTGQELG